MRVRVEICGIDTATLPKMTNVESVALMQKLKTGDLDARREFVINNMRLVLSVIQRFWGNRDNIDDVFQVGCIGLIKAIDNFDTTLNVRFSTYAVPMIMGEIRRYLRDNNSLKVTRSVRDIAYKALQAKEAIERESNQDANEVAIAEKIGVSPYAVVHALDAISEPVSLFEPIYNQTGDAIMILDQIKDDSSSEDKWAENVSLFDAEQKLSEKERQILFLRYYVGKTQIEVSEDVGISQAQVSRLEKCALSRMRAEL
ncbi:MAG: sigma-70 family RNA polymerase sigma factor [Clostridia bacterium]